MGDFFIADSEKPGGQCIWYACESPAVCVLKCKNRTLIIDVCAKHAKKFMDSEIVTAKGGKIGISVHSTKASGKLN